MSVAGNMGILLWDSEDCKFTGCPSVDAHDSRFVLMPPCCGRGAKCPHLQSCEHPQWPDGADLNLSTLEAIPWAFARLLKNELRQSGWQPQRALMASFKTLLGEHYTPPTDRRTFEQSVAESKSQADEPESESDEDDEQIVICEDPPDPPDLPTTDDPSFSTAAAEPAGSQSFRPPVEPPALVSGYPSVVGAIDYVTGRVMKIDMRQWPGESGVEMLERWIREAQSGPEVSPADERDVAEFTRVLQKARARGES